MTLFCNRGDSGAWLPQLPGGFQQAQRQLKGGHRKAEMFLQEPVELQWIAAEFNGQLPTLQRSRPRAPIVSA